MIAPRNCGLCTGHGLLFRRDRDDDLWGAPCRCSTGQAKRQTFIDNTTRLRQTGAPLHKNKHTTHNTERPAA